MYVCKDCNRTFETEKVYYGEQLEYFGNPCRESYVACPYCEGEYSLAIECDSCGELIVGEHIVTAVSSAYCSDCYQVRGSD